MGKCLPACACLGIGDVQARFVGWRWTAGGVVVVVVSFCVRAAVVSSEASAASGRVIKRRAGAQGSAGRGVRRQRQRQTSAPLTCGELYRSLSFR